MGRNDWLGPVHGITHLHTVGHNHHVPTKSRILGKNYHNFFIRKVISDEVIFVLNALWIPVAKFRTHLIFSLVYVVSRPCNIGSAPYKHWVLHVWCALEFSCLLRYLSSMLVHQGLQLQFAPAGFKHVKMSQKSIRFWHRDQTLIRCEKLNKSGHMHLTVTKSMSDCRIYRECSDVPGTATRGRSWRDRLRTGVLRTNVSLGNTEYATKNRSIDWLLECAHLYPCSQSEYELKLSSTESQT